MAAKAKKSPTRRRTTGTKARVRAKASGSPRGLQALDEQTRLECVLDMVSVLLGSIDADGLICVRRPDKNNEYWLRDTRTGAWVAPCNPRPRALAGQAAGVRCLERADKGGEHWLWDEAAQAWLTSCQYPPPWSGARGTAGDVICVSRPDKGGEHWLWDTKKQAWVAPCQGPIARRSRLVRASARRR